MTCPHCGSEIEVTIASLGSVASGVPGDLAANVASARAMVDLKHVAPCQDFLDDPFAVLHA